MVLSFVALLLPKVRVSGFCACSDSAVFAGAILNKGGGGVESATLELSGVALPLKEKDEGLNALSAGMDV